MMILGKSRGAAGIIAVALASSLTLAVAPAAAQTDKPAAPGIPNPGIKPNPGATPAKPADPKAAFVAGERKFKANDFQGALADFQASETAKADPATERYLAMTQDNLQAFPDAVTSYEKFIAANPPSMKTQVDEAKKRVEAIKVMGGKVHVETTPPGASLVIDTSTTPYEKVTPADLDLTAGHHTILIGADGFENSTKELDVTYGSKQDLKVELAKKEAPPPPPPVAAETPSQPTAPPPPPPEPRSKIPAYVTGAVAIAAAGVGVGFGVKALSQSNDFDKNPTTKKADDGENNALVSDMMFGIAITFAVTSAVLFLSNDAPATASASSSKTATLKKKQALIITPTPYVTTNGGGFGAHVRF